MIPALLIFVYCVYQNEKAKPIVTNQNRIYNHIADDFKAIGTAEKMADFLDESILISDIHGQYDAFMEMLRLIDFQSEDELYIIGDLIDRGDKSIECIRWAMEQDNVLVMLGNHEFN